MILSVKVLDPLDIEIISQEINEDTIEKEFEIVETGAYKLIIESISNEESPSIWGNWTTSRRK